MLISDTSSRRPALAARQRVYPEGEQRGFSPPSGAQATAPSSCCPTACVERSGPVRSPPSPCWFRPVLGEDPADSARCPIRPGVAGPCLDPLRLDRCLRRGLAG